jgi:hypothetical protein
VPLLASFLTSLNMNRNRDANCPKILGQDTGAECKFRKPTKMRFHDIGHIVLGHTLASSHVEYATHRGLVEFEA